MQLMHATDCKIFFCIRLYVEQERHNYFFSSMLGLGLSSFGGSVFSDFCHAHCSSFAAAFGHCLFTFDIGVAFATIEPGSFTSIRRICQEEPYKKDISFFMEKRDE